MFVIFILFFVSFVGKINAEIAATSTPAPLVPVLINLSTEEREQLETILLNQNLAIKDMNQQVDAFFESKSASLKSQYETMKKAFADSLKVLTDEHEKAIKSASPTAQVADAQIRAIANNETLTTLQQNRGILQVYLGQTPEVQQELNKYAIFKRTGKMS
uniref:SXP/RAL-2 family protein Ani s 5-like cation-binding domain-containing protein n=1 Tax=Panagrolaimus sp. JU765 TaxID=591449 RepID=A0AC34RRU2_9BILA